MNFDTAHSPNSLNVKLSARELHLQAAKRNVEKLTTTYLCPVDSNETLAYIRGRAGIQEFPKLKDKEELDAPREKVPPHTVKPALLGAAEWPKGHRNEN